MCDLYQVCKDLGALPESGGVLEQDPELVAAFSIIGNELAAEKERLAREAEKRRRRRGRR